MHLRHMIWIQILESQNTDDMTGRGFDPNVYSPIPPVGNTADTTRRSSTTNIYCLSLLEKQT